jgi:hypothetical protein
MEKREGENHARLQHPALGPGSYHTVRGDPLQQQEWPWEPLSGIPPRERGAFAADRSRSGADGEEVQAMAALKEYEVEAIEQLAIDAEILLDEDDARKDLKERRGLIKQTLFDGSKKLKHLVPKGKHL